MVNNVTLKKAIREYNHYQYPLSDVQGHFNYCVYSQSNVQKNLPFVSSNTIDHTLAVIIRMKGPR